MKHFLDDIREYAAARDIPPERVIRDALNAEWGRWGRWQSGVSSPRLDTIERLRAYMAQHPPTPTDREGAA